MTSPTKVFTEVPTKWLFSPVIRSHLFGSVTDEIPSQQKMGFSNIEFNTRGRIREPRFELDAYNLVLVSGIYLLATVSAHA